MQANYRRDLTRENEYRPDCAYHPGTKAVIVVRVDGIQRDVCKRCWEQLRPR